MTADHFCFYLQNRRIQTSQTGGQQYSDTSPFSIPWSVNQSACVIIELIRGVQKLTGENLEPVWAEFSTLS